MGGEQGVERRRPVGRRAHRHVVDAGARGVLRRRAELLVAVREGRRVGARGQSAIRRGEREESRRVESAGEKETAHPPRLAEPERLEHLLADQARQIGALEEALGEGELPVALCAQPPVLPQAHLAGAELADGGVDRGGWRHEAKGHERLERRRIPGADERGQRRERGQARGGGQPPAVGRVVKGNEAELVAREEEPLEPLVPERHRERAAQRLHALHAALLVEVDDHLRIVAARERVAAGEPGAQLAGVVDVAREHGVDALPLVGRHRDRRPRVRQHERAARGVRARPRHRGNADLAPVRERHQAAHQSGRATISTSPWTTVIPYSTPPVLSLACRRKASCSKWTAVGPSERGTRA